MKVSVVYQQSTKFETYYDDQSCVASERAYRIVALCINLEFFQSLSLFYSAVSKTHKTMHIPNFHFNRWQIYADSQSKILF